MLLNYSLSDNEPIVQVELVKVIFQELPLICGLFIVQGHVTWREMIIQFVKQKTFFEKPATNLVTV